MFHFLSTGTPRSSSEKHTSWWPWRQTASSIQWCLGLFLARCRTLHLPFLNFKIFLSVQSSSLFRSYSEGLYIPAGDQPLHHFLSSSILPRRNLPLHPSHWRVSKTILDQDQPLRGSTSYNPPARHRATEHNFPRPAILTRSQFTSSSTHLACASWACLGG